MSTNRSWTSNELSGDKGGAARRQPCELPGAPWSGRTQGGIHDDRHRCHRSPSLALTGLTQTVYPKKRISASHHMCTRSALSGV